MPSPVTWLLLLFIVLAFQAPAHSQRQTRWASRVSAENVLPEYPRPQLVRERWLRLNGLWDYAIRDVTDREMGPADGQILVPFCVESALSRVQQKVSPAERLWYRRSIEIPQTWDNQRVMLHFGAVDWLAEVWLNGRRVGEHRGGYDAFSFDITDFLTDADQQELIVAVWDPTDAGTQPRGKQVRDPQGIWYTSVTGIWQSVWLEPVPETHVRGLRIVPDQRQGRVTVRADVVGDKDGVTVRVESPGARDRNDNLLTFPPSAKHSWLGKVSEPIECPLPVAYPWTVEEPWLYDLTVTLLDENGQPLDRVNSYFGLRDIERKPGSGGHPRLFLNGKEVFQLGPLDQGWWPDGLYTAPTDEALRYDIEITKKLGFNMARKHVKVEPARWYYWCDKLGLLVWQDMPNGDAHIGARDPDIVRSAQSARQFEDELLRIMSGLHNHPCIVVWVPFNEGWGQYDTARVTQLVKDADPSRLVINTSGWADRGVGDIHDMHAYPGPDMPTPESERAVVLGEFGGLGLPVEGHLWQDEENWGYRGFQDVAALTAAYANLFRDLQPLVKNGLAAAVYTQTTDVETEVNGLMTYDRAVIKMPFTTVSHINQGYVPPKIQSPDPLFMEATSVIIDPGTREGTVRYTTDGSSPSATSPVYQTPLKLSESTEIQARTFWPTGEVSSTSSFTVQKAVLRTPASLPKSELVSGLRYRYFEDENERWSQIPDFDTLEPVAMGIVAQPRVNLARREKFLAFEFTGYLEVPRDGIYEFLVNSNDGSKLYIDDQLVVDNDFSHGLVEKSGKIALRAGLFPLRLTYFQGDGSKDLELSFSTTGLEKQPVPAERLLHRRHTVEESLPEPAAALARVVRSTKSINRVACGSSS